MAATVFLYDTFFDFDIGSLKTAAFKLALIQSTYTFDSTDASASADILVDETTGTGYAEITGVAIIEDTDAARVGYYKLDKAGPPTFASMTTTDYRYCLYYDSGTNKPLLIIDVGAGTPLTASVLIVSGDVYTVSG